jgi:hypothetical protein
MFPIVMAARDATTSDSKGISTAVSFCFTTPPPLSYLADSRTCERQMKTHRTKNSTTARNWIIYPRDLKN